MSVCLNNCGNFIKASECSIQCDVCQGQLHLGCIGLSENDMKITRKKSKFIKVICNSCNSNLTQFKDLKGIISSLKTDFETSLASLKSDFELKLNELKASLTEKQQCSGSTNFEDVVQEIYERQKRKQNIVMFNVPETLDVSFENQKEQDRIKVTNILNAINPNVSTNEIRIQRLGRLDPVNPKSRVIKVTLNQENDVHVIIKNVKALKNNEHFRNVSVAFDKTPKQIEHYKRLQQELQSRISKGEKNLKIKYYNGVPSIARLN